MTKAEAMWADIKALDEQGYSDALCALPEPSPAGYTEEQLRAALRAAGYTDEQIDNRDYPPRRKPRIVRGWAKAIW
jgi:hypothetical protein